MIKSRYKQIDDWIWARNPGSKPRRAVVVAARFILALLRDVMEGEISLRALSLVYTTLLSFVPFLALSFSVLKALGVHDSLEPMLLKLMQPLGDQAPAVASQVIGFVDNVKVGVLGSVGVATLLYTSVSMISKIEKSFNFIWSIGSVRGFAQRFSEYLTVLLIGPMLIFSALGITAAVRNSSFVTHLAVIEPFGTLILVVTKGTPYVLIVAAFTFLYMLIPNTQVKWRAAFAGGLFAGVAWESASAAFAAFVADSARYSVIYSGFAIVIVLLIWLYVGWQIILFGCRLAFYIQNPAFLKISTTPVISGAREAEFLALRVFSLIGKRFLEGSAPMGVDDLRRELMTAADDVNRAIAILVAGGLLIETLPAHAFVPARSLSSLTLAELWNAARGALVSRQMQGVDIPALKFMKDVENRAAEAGEIKLDQWLGRPEP